MKCLRMAALGVGCLTFLAACATEPTEEELAESILAATDGDPTFQLTEERARCIARELLASDLSDTTLSGLAENFDRPEVLETEVDDVEPLVAAAALVCR